MLADLGLELMSSACLCQIDILKTALLRYHWHAIWFTHLKYTIQQLSVYSKNCVTTTINFRAFFLPPPKKNNHSSLPSPPVSPGLGNPNVLSVSLALSLLLVELYNMWFFVTGFFHLALYFQCSSILCCIIYISVLHFSLLSNNIPSSGYNTFYLSSHQLIATWVVSTFWLLRIVLLWTFIYKILCGSVF